MSARAVSRLIACAVLAGCSSCLWLPFHGQEEAQLGAISPEAKLELAPGQATRADVLCRLGVPQWQSADGSRFVYATREVQGQLIVYLVVDGDFSWWGEDRYDLCEFDARGVLLRWREARRDFSNKGDDMRKLGDLYVADLFPG